MNVEIIIALISLVVAMIAVAISVIYNRATLNQSIEHNKLSTKPLLCLPNAYNDNQVYVKYLNVGYGPCVIEEFIFCIDGERIEISDHKGLREAFNKRSMFKDCGIITNYLTKGAPVGIGEEEMVLLITTRSDHQHNSKILSEIKKRISIHIKYKSLYGDEFEANFPRTSDGLAGM